MDIEYLHTVMQKKEHEAGAYKWSEKTDGTQHIYDDGYAPIGAIVSYAKYDSAKTNGYHLTALHQTPSKVCYIYG